MLLKQIWNLIRKSIGAWVDDQSEHAHGYVHIVRIISTIYTYTSPAIYIGMKSGIVPTVHINVVNQVVTVVVDGRASKDALGAANGVEHRGTYIYIVK